MRIPVFHMEARQPLLRRPRPRRGEPAHHQITAADFLLPYTERGRQNLLREGIPVEKIFVTGNPIYEVIQHFEPSFAATTILSDLGLLPGGYFLVTMHRAENVDVEQRLLCLVQALDQLQRQYQAPVVVSTHPHDLRKDEGLWNRSGK